MTDPAPTSPRQPVSAEQWLDKEFPENGTLLNHHAGRRWFTRDKVIHLLEIYRSAFLPVQQEVARPTMPNDTCPKCGSRSNEVVGINRGLKCSDCEATWKPRAAPSTPPASSPTESVNFVSEVIPDAPNPSCHVCGALMIAVEWRCLSCQASTKPTELNQETVTPQQWAKVRERLIQLAQKMNAASSHNTTEGK